MMIVSSSDMTTGSHTQSLPVWASSSWTGNMFATVSLIEKYLSHLLEKRVLVQEFLRFNQDGYPILI